MDATFAEDHRPADVGREATLRRLGLDRPNDVFDRIARLVVRAVRARFAAIGVLGEEHEVLVGQHGLPEPHATTRVVADDLSLCRLVIAADDAVVIDDVTRDARTATSAFARRYGEVGYLGVPVRAEADEPLGALCVMATGPRAWDDEDVEVLEDAAHAVRRELQLWQAVQRQQGLNGDGERVRTVAHDLRTPLTTVMAGAEMLTRPEITDEERAVIGRAVLRQSARLASMASGLLGPVDPATGFDPVQPLADVVRHVVLARTIAGRGERLALHVGDDVTLDVPAEPAASIVTNLVDNALLHTRGPVRIHLLREGEQVVLTVADHGPGFDPAAMAEGRASPRGTGLGRSIVAHHVAQLGGRVEVDSAPDRGTTATVRLPAGG